MRETDSIRSPRRTAPAAQQSLATRREVVGSEDLHVRNYDHRWGYDLTVEVREPDGTMVFEKRYYLQPGQVESELGVLAEGEYEFRATLDNLQEEQLRCRVDPAPEHTAVIEVGNGALSLTEGLLG